MNRNKVLFAGALLALLVWFSGPAVAAPIGGNPGACGMTKYCRVIVTDSAGTIIEQDAVRLEIHSTGEVFERGTEAGTPLVFEIPAGYIYCCPDTATLYLDEPPLGHNATQFELVFDPPLCDGEVPDDPVKEWDFGGGAAKQNTGDCADVRGGITEEYVLWVAYPSGFGNCPF